MAISRRDFIRLTLGTGVASLAGCASGEPGALLGGYRTRDNQFGVAAIRPDGNALWFRQLPGRLHEIVVAESEALVVAVARRPGEFISLLDLFTGEKIHQIEAPKGFVFEGHALWQQQSLWATAADTNGQGYLLAFDLSGGLTTSTKPHRSIPLPGLGPHQILEVGGSLVVAMGGWKTQGRTILNAGDFDSSLVWVNPESGEAQSLSSPDSQLSVRHLATDGSRVWAGMQYAQPRATQTALVYQTDGSTWQPLEAPATGWKVFSGYIGSVAATNAELLATSPQGHSYGRWDLVSGVCIESANVLDVCPAAATGSEWYLGSGTGEIRTSSSSWHRSDFFWDNHWAYTNA